MFPGGNVFAVLGQPWRNHVRQCVENSDKTGRSPGAQAQCLKAGTGLVRSCREHRRPWERAEWQRDAVGQRWELGWGVQMRGGVQGEPGLEMEEELGSSVFFIACIFCLALKMYCLVRERKRTMHITVLQCQNCFFNSVKHQDSDSLTPCPLGSKVSPGR